MKCTGALFDFDGVLFDTERHHEICWFQVALERGQSITREQFLKGFGVKNYYFIEKILGWSSDPTEIHSIEKRKEMLFIERIKTHTVESIPGTINLLDRFVKKQIPCCIGSSSVLRNIALLLEPYPHIKAKFQGIITAENVTYGKPHPDVFLKGADCIKSSPKTTIVFEDAPLGIIAAKAAGMKAVGLTTTFSKEELQKALPDLIVPSLELLQIEDIEALF